VIPEATVWSAGHRPGGDPAASRAPLPVTDLDSGRFHHEGTKDTKKSKTRRHSKDNKNNNKENDKEL
jgi:hypothetical protein